MAEESTKQSRVILWGVPRSISTSFLKCLTFVEDSVCWHEPYLYAQMVGTDGANTKFNQKMMQEMMSKMQGKLPTPPMDMSKLGDNIYDASAHDFAWIKKRLEEPYAGKKLIFNKDMVQGIDGHYDALPNGYRHTFVIRHPLKVFKSFKRMGEGIPFAADSTLQQMTPYMIPAGFFFKEMYDLVEYVKKELDPEPIIIDADDLLADPGKMMKAYCDALGIQYNESLLSWPVGSEVMFTKWISPKELLMAGQMAHKSTFESTGFGKPSSMPNKDELAADVVEVAELSMQYYDKLYEQRFKCK